jgi:hypothetical protein
MAGELQRDGAAGRPRAYDDDIGFQIAQRPNPPFMPTGAAACAKRVD